MKEGEKRSEKRKMVAMALYRGNLHRVPKTPRRWPPPSRSLSSSQFRSLLRRRSLALSRLSTPSPSPPLPPPLSHDDTEKDAKEKEDNHSVPKEEAKRQQEVVEEEEEEEEGELADSDSTDSPSHLDLLLPLPVKKEEEVTITPLEVNAEAGLTDKEERKKELENKLEELNLKKHNLVQMLKQILNAEEEMKRRINPSTVIRGSGGPAPSESGPDAPFASRPGLGRMSVEVNFSTDFGGESDPHSTKSAPTRPFCQMQSPSPSGSSLSRSPFSHTPRPPQASSSLLGNALISPARFVPPTGQLGHVSSLPPLLPLPGTNFTASSPSPAASGGAPPVFRDSRFGSSS